MPDDPKQPFSLDDIEFGATIRGHQKGDRVFDRFVLQKLLGRGGMGVVWLALDERLGREVALKFAPEVIRYDEIAIEELKEETRKGLGLAHPNIVRIYDFLLDEDHAAISMEFIDGQNLGALRALQPNKVFEPHQIETWVAQLLDALDYAHRGAKVIHRDLKPANLMIDHAGNLRVTDFGIARSISDAMDRATLGRASTGTLAYMSPQQASGKKPHVSDDIYAFGSTLYELITGKPPFYTGSIAEQLRNDAVTPPTDRRREFNITGAEPLPVEWEQTILACLEKSVENRPASAQAIMARLGLTAAARPVGETPVVLPGAAPAAGFAPGSQTSHTTAYVRPGSGLTEIGSPGRPLTASRVRVASQPATEAPPTAQPPPAAPPSARSRRRGWMIAAGVVWLLAVLGAAGWWGFETWRKNSASRRGAPAPPVTLVVTSPAVSLPPPAASPPALPAEAPGVAAPVKASATAMVAPEPPTPPPPITSPPPPPHGKIATLLARAKADETITLEDGTYEELIQFKEGVHLRARNPGKVIVQISGKSGPVLRVEKCSSGSIAGLVFQHPGNETAGPNSPPVAQIISSSITLEDCAIQRSLGSGLEISGPGQPKLDRCTLANNQAIGLVLEAGTRAVVKGCTIKLNGQSGVEIRHSGTAPLLTGNTVSNNNDSGIVVKDGAGATLSEINQCHDNGEAGIAVVGQGTEATISDARCDGNKFGVAVVKSAGSPKNTPGARARITRCVIRKSKEMGIHFGNAAADSELRENTIESSSVYGLLITGLPGTTVVVAGNHVSQNALTGIVCIGEGFRPLVERNECARNGEYGIVMAEGASGIVRGNILGGNNRGGIGQQNAATDLLIEGNIVSDDAAAK